MLERRRLEEEMSDEAKKFIGKLTMKECLLSHMWLFEDPKITTEKLFTASTSYYSIAVNARLQAQKASLFYKPILYWQAWRSFKLAKEYSDKFADLKPMKSMTLNELNTRACILRESGFH